MTARHSDMLSRIIWPLLIVAAAALWLLSTLGVLPTVILDLIERGWPALLVALGLMLILGRRVRFGNAIAVGISATLAAGMLLAAYNRESAIFREDYKLPVAYIVDPAVTSVRTVIEMRQTTIDIQPSGDREIRGEFVGSLESLVSQNYQVEGGIATLTLRETPRNAVPSLTQVGRGKLTLFLPVGVTLAQLTIIGKEGDLTLDASSVSLKQLSVTLDAGSISAQFANESGLIGDLKTARGEISVTIPPGIAAQIALRGSGADAARFSDALYTLRIDKVLVPKSAADPQMQLTLDAAGAITIR